MCVAFVTHAVVYCYFVASFRLLVTGAGLVLQTQCAMQCKKDVSDENAAFGLIKITLTPICSLVTSPTAHALCDPRAHASTATKKMRFMLIFRQQDDQYPPSPIMVSETLQHSVWFRGGTQLQLQLRQHSVCCCPNRGRV